MSRISDQNPYAGPPRSPLAFFFGGGQAARFKGCQGGKAHCFWAESLNQNAASRVIRNNPESIYADSGLDNRTNNRYHTRLYSEDGIT